jgi:hypothetical protein
LAAFAATFFLGEVLALLGTLGDFLALGTSVFLREGQTAKYS